MGDFSLNSGGNLNTGDNTMGSKITISGNSSFDIAQLTKMLSELEISEEQKELALKEANKASSSKDSNVITESISKVIEVAGQTAIKWLVGHFVGF